MDDNGTMAVVLPHGALFRGGAEGAIREFIIREKNWLDAVIGLPANIFYGTGIPTCIMVFKKCRETDEVLFVDASSCFEKAKNQNYLRERDIDRIVEAYRSRAGSRACAHNAPRSEIQGTTGTWNIPRYVETFQVEAPIDLAAVTADLKAVDAEMEGVDAKLRAFCAELGLESPV
ncbi:class I SAM-dependent DNA methyltransferase [Paracoccus sp. DMF-8]|uniref:N-6 DNA methylase n=1 Tax=Paracoccus sp. DMF-8 TaxID=3019445 RepID=UPI0023E363C1|nr:class I SAM-dependent DNA methyltransferase [Paracoccus sp. DMF-8]MDF3608356.1 class I SAM-dependent DNA methyltransferase [Paracoccus sp. DMF-8]